MFSTDFLVGSDKDQSLVFVPAGLAQAAAWTPAALGGNLYLAVKVREIRAAGGLWQNAGKTIPAVADGDPVRVVTDPWAHIDLTAPDDASRGTLRADATETWVIEGDGLATAYENGGLDWASPAVSVAARVRVTAFEDYQAVAITTPEGGGWRLVTRLPGAGWGTWGGSDQPADTTLGTATWYTLAMAGTVGGGGVFRRGGAGDGTWAATSGTADGTTGLSLMHESDTNPRVLDGRLSGIVVSLAAEAGAALANMEAWLST